MTIVEQFHPGFQWAEPLQGKELDVEAVDRDLQITGLVPLYQQQDSPCDLICQYEKSPRQLEIGQARTGTQSPAVCFANADSDEKLIAFVRRFGPVVAKSVEDTAMIPDKELGEPPRFGRLIARQDMEELRKEQITFRAALALVAQLDQGTHNYVSVQQLKDAIGERMAEELNQPPATYDRGLAWHVMKLIDETLAEQLGQPPPCDILARDILKVVAANIAEEFDGANHASAQHLMNIITASVQNYVDQPIYDYFSAQKLIRTIATNIREWPSQWEREKLLRRVEPRWKLSSESLKRIEYLSNSRRDLLISDFVDGRVVICELLNSFPSTIFPSPIEMHSSIKYGIRPLLYSILRRQFINARGLAFCANTECRNFFNMERAGQQFCSSECSLHHRQRIYWQKQGKKLRKKRSANARKIQKQAAKLDVKKIARRRTS